MIHYPREERELFEKYKNKDKFYVDEIKKLYEKYKNDK
jgi:hypothetical protein